MFFFRQNWSAVQTQTKINIEAEEQSELFFSD